MDGGWNDLMDGPALRGSGFSLIPRGVSPSPQLMRSDGMGIDPDLLTLDLIATSLAGESYRLQDLRVPPISRAQINVLLCSISPEDPAAQRAALIHCAQDSFEWSSSAPQMPDTARVAADLSQRLMLRDAIEARFGITPRDRERVGSRSSGAFNLLELLRPDRTIPLPEAEAKALFLAAHGRICGHGLPVTRDWLEAA